MTEACCGRQRRKQFSQGIKPPKCVRNPSVSWAFAYHKCFPNALVKYVGKRRTPGFSILK